VGGWVGNYSTAVLVDTRLSFVANGVGRKCKSSRRRCRGLKGQLKWPREEIVPATRSGDDQSGPDNADNENGSASSLIVNRREAIPLPSLIHRFHNLLS